jgi:hypothetical protein
LYEGELSGVSDKLIDDEEEERILASSFFEERTLSEEIAIGLSPRTFSINHLWEFDIIFVDESDSGESENPSVESSFCSLAKIMSETTAARSPVGQSISAVKIKGTTKNKNDPNVLSKNSMDFRDTICAKDPATIRPAIDRIVNGQCKTS